MNTIRNAFFFPHLLKLYKIYKFPLTLFYIIMYLFSYEN